MLSKTQLGITIAQLTFCNHLAKGILTTNNRLSKQASGACDASHQAHFVHHSCGGLTSACAHQKMQNCSQISKK